MNIFSGNTYLSIKIKTHCKEIIIVSLLNVIHAAKLARTINNANTFLP